MFIVGVIAAAIVVLSVLYGVSVFVALIVEEYRWRKQFEEDKDDSGENDT